MADGLDDYSLSELSLFVVSVIGACGGICGIIFKGLSTSRCENCSLCCGLVSVKNDPPTAEELEKIAKLTEEASLPKKKKTDKNDDDAELPSLV
tara:strand:- start:4136 stop:4417 length:282 start_codon:yes stop_codon:yes gene_type:complete